MAKVVANKTTKKPANDSLADLRTAIESGDATAALAAALTAWRAQRAPALAAIVEAIESPGEAIVDDGAWMQTAASKDPAQLGRLLAGVIELPASFLPSAADMLAAFPDDPRIATAIATWALDPPTTSSSTYPFWSKTLALLERTADTRVIPVLKKRLKRPQPARKDRWSAGKPSQFWGKFYKALQKVVDALEELPAVAVDAKAAGKLATAACKLALPAVAVVAKAPAMKGNPLEHARKHAEAGRVQPAIDALLVAWRAQRTPQLADLIDRATRLLPSYDQGFPVEPKAAHAAWMDAFARDPAAELPRLLAHVCCGGASVVERQVITLAQLADDPRVALRFAEVAVGGNASPERTQFWKSLWEQVARIADVRTVTPLRQGFNDFQGKYFDHHRQGKRLAGDFVLSPPSPPALDAAALTHVHAIEAALAKLEAGADRQRELVAAIVKDWTDDGPRLVYADWLTEREHPRGEAILLGCKATRTPAEDKRVKQLRGGYTSATHLWGPISDLEFTLERGMPSKLRADWRTSTLTWRALAGHPLAAVVESIELDEDDRAMPLPEYFAAVLLDPGATRLATVTNVPPMFSEVLMPLLGKRWKRNRNTLERA